MSLHYAQSRPKTESAFAATAFYPHGGSREFLYKWEKIDRDSDRISEIWDDDLKEYIRDQYVTKIGAEEDWPKTDITSHQKSVAFDEPLLGIIGMWRQGGGANPHFCLCIGEIMFRLNQRRIAWTAFERCKQLVAKFWPKPEIQQTIRDHCERRQKEIEKTLPADDVAELRPAFNEELAYGLRFQKEYQDYEEAKIGDGKNIADEHFFDSFYNHREPIASPTGPEEMFVFEMQDYRPTFPRVFPGGAACAGAFAFVTSLWMYRRARNHLQLNATLHDQQF
jgi:hypothetical protein